MPPPRRVASRRARLWRWIGGSALLHALLVALLLWMPPREPPPEPGLGNEVPVVFENAGSGPALPQPQEVPGRPGEPEPTPDLPQLPDAPPIPTPPVPAPPAPNLPLPNLPVPPQPVPPLASVPPLPSAPAVPPPVPAPPLAQVAPPPAPPAPPSETRPQESPAEPPPPADTAELALPPPPPPAPDPPEQAAPPVALPPRPRPVPSSPFPGTLDLTRRPPVALAPPGGSPRPSRPPGSLDLSLGRVPQQRRPASRQDTDGNIDHVAGAEASGSWRGAFLAWVRARAFYPPQAAANGEDGDSSVTLVIDRSGRIRSVELRRRSGSRWLDLGLQSIFRDQQVPAFTPDMEGESMTLTFTMHYILVYR